MNLLVLRCTFLEQKFKITFAYVWQSCASIYLILIFLIVRLSSRFVLSYLDLFLLLFFKSLLYSLFVWLDLESVSSSIFVPHFVPLTC
uniref:Putative ovule protein n=1 Tax=Solanum chacoense TaxID=4108 RepID=A0A0V0IN83_SOLCH